TKQSVSDGNNQNETAKETCSCNAESGPSVSSSTVVTTVTATNDITTTTLPESSSLKSKDISINNESQSAKIIHRPLLLPDIVRSLNQARKSRMRSRPLTRAKNRRENEELDMYKLGLDMIDSQSGK